MRYPKLDLWSQTENNLQIWQNFLNTVFKKYPFIRTVNMRYYVDNELKEFKSTWATDNKTYSYIVFDNEKYLTLFLLKFC